MAILKTPAFFLKNSTHMVTRQRFGMCHNLAAPCISAVDKAKQEDIKEAFEATLTEEEQNVRQDRRERYKPKNP